MYMKYDEDFEISLSSLTDSKNEGSRNVVYTKHSIFEGLNFVDIKFLIISPWSVQWCLDCMDSRSPWRINI